MDRLFPCNENSTLQFAKLSIAIWWCLFYSWCLTDKLLHKQYHRLWTFLAICFLPTFITWQYPKPSECEAYYTKNHFCTSLTHSFHCSWAAPLSGIPNFFLSSQMPILPLLLPPLPASCSQGRCVMTNSHVTHQKSQNKKLKSAALDFFSFLLCWKK